MNSSEKNKLLIWLVALLLVANAASIAMFWLGKSKQPPPPKETPKEFLIRELKMDTKQQQQFEILVTDHQQKAMFIRDRVKMLKENFFDLLKQPNVTDSIKNEKAATVSYLVQKLDLLAFEHFQKIRALCNSEQQKKFDEIINEVTAMMGQPRPPMGPGNDRQGPPPGGLDGDRPPPPGQ
jgi:Spy/CpxP family protein refolding chaperone